MNPNLLNLLALLLASATANTDSQASIESQLWLDASRNPLTQEHHWHTWEPSTVHKGIIQAKLERMSVPQQLKPFEEAMVMFKAAGFKSAETVMEALKTAPNKVPKTLLDALLRLPAISDKDVPKATLTQRLHPGIRFARLIGTDAQLLDRIKMLRSAQDCGPEINSISDAFVKILGASSLLAGDNKDLPQSLGLLTTYYNLKMKSTSVPSVQELVDFVKDRQGLDVFFKGLNPPELATMVRAVEAFWSASNAYVHSSYASPKHIEERFKSLNSAIENSMIYEDAKVAKNKSMIAKMDASIKRFHEQYETIRRRFNLPPTASFRGFMKQFDQLLVSLRDGLTRAGKVLHVDPVLTPTKTSDPTIMGNLPVGGAKPGELQGQLHVDDLSNAPMFGGRGITSSGMPNPIGDPSHSGDNNFAALLQKQKAEFQHDPTNIAAHLENQKKTTLYHAEQHIAAHINQQAIENLKKADGERVERKAARAKQLTELRGELKAMQAALKLVTEHAAHLQAAFDAYKA